MKKINWKVRFNKENIVFIVQVIVSVVTPVLAYFGMEATDLTSWSIVWDTILQALSNPYVVLLMIVSFFNAVIDPTTKGVGDSKQALTYKYPKKEVIENKNTES